jgi:hypothetical protein
MHKHLYRPDLVNSGAFGEVPAPGSHAGRGARLQRVVGSQAPVYPVSAYPNLSLLARFACAVSSVIESPPGSGPTRGLIFARNGTRSTCRVRSAIRRTGASCSRSRRRLRPGWSWRPQSRSLVRDRTDPGRADPTPSVRTLLPPRLPQGLVAGVGPVSALSSGSDRA